MSVNFAILVLDGKTVESVNVRELDSDKDFDLSDCDGVIDFLAYFLDLSTSSLVLEKHSPFARYATVTYENTFTTKEIILTWENFQ